MIDCSPQLHVAAIHAEAGYNTSVPGLGVLCVADTLIIGAGSFQNSVGHASNYAVVGEYLGHAGPLRLGYIIGAIDGYPRNDYKPMPWAAAVATYPLPWGAVHMTAVPAVSGYTPAFVQFSITINLEKK